MAGGRHSGAVISHEAPRRPREPGQPAVQSTVGLAPTETRRDEPARWAETIAALPARHACTRHPVAIDPSKPV